MSRLMDAFLLRTVVLPSLTERAQAIWRTAKYDTDLLTDSDADEIRDVITVLEQALEMRKGRRAA